MSRLRDIMNDDEPVVKKDEFAHSDLRHCSSSLHHHHHHHNHNHHHHSHSHSHHHQHLNTSSSSSSDSFGLKPDQHNLHHIPYYESPSSPAYYHSGVPVSPPPSNYAREADLPSPTQHLADMDRYGNSAYGNAAAHMGGGMRYGQPMDAMGQVKLTPVTGRVSRAKKGIPVHTCPICNKTFTRAEHLRRHQLSHGRPEFRCPAPGCDREFHRKDLLDRHQLRHETEPMNAGELL